MFTSGRTSIPGLSISITNVEIPRCFGASGSVRAASQPMFEKWPPLVQILLPLITHSSPSRTARVCNDARSDPAPGSEYSVHHWSMPPTMFGRYFAFCSSVPNSMIAGPTQSTPIVLPLGIEL